MFQRQRFRGKKILSAENVFSVIREKKKKWERKRREKKKVGEKEKN
jgi:hypothetical protein